MRRINLKFIIIIIVGSAVLAVTAVALRNWQKNRMALGRLTSGLEAYNSARYEQAASDLGKYIVVVPDDVQILLKYANCHLNIRPLKRKNIQHAISTYRAVLRVDAANAQASQMLVELYLKMGMYGESELIASRQLELAPDPNIERMLVASFVGQRKFKESFDMLKKIVQKRSDDVLAYEALASLSRQRPEQSDVDSRQWLDKAVENNPDAAMAYIVRAAAQISTDPNSAAADLAKAQTLDLSNIRTRLRLCQELINAGMLDTARKHLVVLEQNNKDDVDVWQAWAMWAIKSRLPGQMLSVASKGMAQLDSQKWDFMPVAAELFIDGGDFQKASQCLDELDKQDVAPASVAYLRGLLASRQGKGYEAVSCFRKSIGLGNENPRLFITLAQTLAILGDEQSAINQMRLLVSKNPDSEDARLYLAKLLLQNNDPDGAAAQAQEMLQYSASSTTARQILAQAYIQQQGGKLASDTSARVQISSLLNEIQSAASDDIQTVMLNFQFAIQSGKLDEAAGHLATLTRLWPDDTEVAVAAADLLIARHQIDAAITKLAETVKKYPDSIAPIKCLVNVLVENQKQSQAADVLHDAITRTKDASVKRNLGLMLVEQYRRFQDKNKAYTLLDSLDSQVPNDIIIKRRLLTFENVVEDASRADSLIRQIKAIEGQDGWQWRYEQAKLWFVLKGFKDKMSQIVSLLQENLRANPEDQESRLLLAMTYDRAGDMQLAVSTYEEALARSPRDLRVIVPTVACLQKAKEYEKADRIITQTARDNISHPILTGYTLQNTLRKGHLASASGILEQLRSGDPNNQSLDLYLAIIRMRQNDYASASKLLNDLRTRQPDSIQVAGAFVELCIRQNDSSKAIAVCDEMIKKLHSSEAYLLRARTCQALKNRAAALADYQQAARLDPNNAQVQFHLGQYYYSAGQLEKAVPAIENAMRLDPQNEDMIKQSIELFLQSSRPELAQTGLKMLNTALASNPADLELQTVKARTLLSAGTKPAAEEAISILTKITDSNPVDSQAWQLLTQAWLDKGDWTSALDTALRGLVFLPNNRELLLYKARAQAAQNPLTAIPTLKFLHGSDPNDSEAALHLASVYAMTDSYKDALDVLRQQLPRASGSLQRRIAIAMAIALYKNGDKSDALKQFDQLRAADANDPTIVLAQATILKDERNWDKIVSDVCAWFKAHPDDVATVITVTNDIGTSPVEQSRHAAIEILRTAVSVKKNSYPLMSSMAKILFISGQNDQAAEVYQKVLELEPGDLVAMNNLAWILCEEQGKYKDALEITQKGLSIAPKYLDLIDTRGMAFFRLGQYEKAIEDFNTCTQLYPTNAPSAAASNFHLGRAYAVRGETQKAVRYLRTAMEMNHKTASLSQQDVTEAQNLLSGLLKESKL